MNDTHLIIKDFIDKIVKTYCSKHDIEAQELYTFTAKFIRIYYSTEIDRYSIGEWPFIHELESFCLLHKLEYFIYDN